MNEAPKEPLDYAGPEKPARSLAGAGCLVLSLLFAVAVGVLWFMVVGMAFDNGSPGWVLLAIAGPLALGIGGFLLQRRFPGALSIAAAIALIALASFFLLFGICAENIRI